MPVLHNGGRLRARRAAPRPRGVPSRRALAIGEKSLGAENGQLLPTLEFTG